MQYQVNLFLPLYFLCSCKLELLYSRILNDIDSILGSKWSPKAVVVDFEKSLINSIRNHFSSTVVIGCFFHFKQAIFRKIVKLGLKNELSQWYLVLKSISALTFEHPNNLLNSISQMKNSFGDEWNSFFTYFENTWIKSYPPDLWNVQMLKNSLNESHLICRTNNALERYNRKLNENLVSHGNIVTLIEFLKMEHNFFRSEILAARDDDTVRKHPVEIVEDPILSESLAKVESKKKEDQTPKKRKRSFKMRRSKKSDDIEDKSLRRKRKKNRNPKTPSIKENKLYWSQFTSPKRGNFWIQGRV